VIAPSTLRRLAVAATPFVALVWLVAVLAAAVADGYEEAAWWLLLLNQLVLAPAAVVAALLLGGILGGRVIGMLSAALLALVPLLGVAYSLAGYRDTYVDVVLPEAAGIAAGGRWPAGALSLVAGALAILSVETTQARRAAAALGGGAAAGIAALVHPSGALVLVGIAFAYALVWTPVAAGLTALAALPGVVVAALAYGLSLDVSWDAFTAHMTGLREYLWSNRVLQWLPLAGVIGAARGSPPVAALLAGWFGAFVVVYGASPNLNAEGGSYLLAFVPALPALSLLVAALPLLLPSLPRRLEGLGTPV
jgi:hypothetical protein